MSRAGGAPLVQGNAVSILKDAGAALAGRRSLGAAESNVVLYWGVALLSLTIIGLWWPYVIALPLGLLGSWFAISLLLHARELRAAERRRPQ